VFAHLSSATVAGVVERHNGGQSDAELASWLNQSHVPVSSARAKEQAATSWTAPLVAELLDQAADGTYRNLRLDVAGR
jgi:hypothetical protein